MPIDREKIVGVNKSKEAKLAARAMRPEDVEACPGNGEKFPCGKPADPAISGYDDVFRCLDCHKFHIELVLLESGDSEPNASEDRTQEFLAVPKGQDGQAARATALLDKLGAAKRAQNEPLIVGPGVDRVRAEQREAERLARENEKRAGIVARLRDKYLRKEDA